MTEAEGADIEIVEVCPRDGLQNERRIVGTDDKVTLVHDMVAAGLRRIEVTSFVHPGVVPQMADAEHVVAKLDGIPDLRFIGLVLNRRGALRAIQTERVHEVNYVVPVTDAFGKANQGQTTREALGQLAAIQQAVRDAGLRFSVTLAVAFGCPYEGDVPVDRVARVAAEVAASSPDELALADTIGCAVPADVSARVRAVRQESEAAMRVHFHQTRNTALANTYVAIEEGVRIHDGSAAGIGGCPFAPGAAGNVATEDLAWMLERSGLRTGVDIEAVVAAGKRICTTLDVPPRSALSVAGPFPTTSPR